MLLDWYVEGKLKPHISRTYRLEEVKTALNSFTNRQSTGRLVLTIRDT